MSDRIKKILVIIFIALIVFQIFAMSRAKPQYIDEGVIFEKTIKIEDIKKYKEEYSQKEKDLNN